MSKLVYGLMKSKDVPSSLLVTNKREYYVPSPREISKSWPMTEQAEIALRTSWVTVIPWEFVSNV